MNMLERDRQGQRLMNMHAAEMHQRDLHNRTVQRMHANALTANLPGWGREGSRNHYQITG